MSKEKEKEKGLRGLKFEIVENSKGDLRSDISSNRFNILELRGLKHSFDDAIEQLIVKIQDDGKE